MISGLLQEAKHSMDCMQGPLAPSQLHKMQMCRIVQQEVLHAYRLVP